MTEESREKLIATILRNEELRPLSRLARLVKDPIHAFPYYILAAISHLRPFRITFSTLWNTKMTCYLPEGNTFYYYGFCEANLTNFFIRYLGTGMTVIDVGAHVGIYSMLSAKLVGEQGKVFSFEPTPWTFELLRKNTKTLPNVSIFNKAISDHERTLTFLDYGPGFGAYNSAHQAGAADLKKTADEIAVTSISLDSFCKEKSLEPGLIKIDAEGFEFEVLKGSLAILKNKIAKRPLISMEVAGGETWIENRRESFTLLTSCQYVPYEINNAGLISPHTLRDSYTYDNLLFIPQERVLECNRFTV